MRRGVRGPARPGRAGGVMWSSGTGRCSRRSGAGRSSRAGVGACDPGRTQPGDGGLRGARAWRDVLSWSRAIEPARGGAGLWSAHRSRDCWSSRSPRAPSRLAATTAGRPGGEASATTTASTTGATASTTAEGPTSSSTSGEATGTGTSTTSTSETPTGTTAVTLDDDERHEHDGSVDQHDRAELLRPAGGGRHDGLHLRQEDRHGDPRQVLQASFYNGDADEGDDHVVQRQGAPLHHRRHAEGRGVRRAGGGAAAARRGDVRREAAARAAHQSELRAHRGRPCYPGGAASRRSSSASA